MNFRLTAIHFGAAFILLISAACAPKEVQVSDQSRIPVNKSADLAFDQAEKDFHKMHLFGWRKAEDGFLKAYDLSPDEKVKKRILLTNFLILMRELDENIFDKGHPARLDQLCNASEPDVLRFCETAKTVLRIKRILSGDAPEFRTEELESIVQGKEPSELGRYLFLLMIREVNPPLYFEELDRYLLDYPESAVSAYLKIQNKIPIAGFLPEDEISEFSEFLYRNGFALIQQKAFFEGIQQIQRAVELIPNHTPALKYLGATYLYSLEHYQKALESYDQAIGVDPRDVDALLGKAVSLHYLGKNLESNSILADTFQPNKARWEILDREQTTYFRGQGYYFQAYNDYLLGSRKSARKLVDLALQYQPDEDGPHYLSGVLYFEDREFEMAQDEFLKVIVNGTSLCDAYFKLGKIRIFEESIKALEFFEANRYCLETTIRNQDQKIDEISDLHLDPKTKGEIIQSLQERKGNYVDQGIASAFNMISSAKKLEGVGVQEFLGSMENFWQRLTALKETSSKIE